MAKIFEEKKQLLSSLEDWLKDLPADTKSVQVCAYAFTDNYDNYTDGKTKTVKEEDIWWNLSASDQMILLTDSVTSALKSTTEFVSLPAETEEELALVDIGRAELKKQFSRLARSFDLILGKGAQDNLETAASSEEQIERLFDGVLGFENREIYNLLWKAFSKKESMTDVLDQLQWKLMTKRKATTSVKKPIGKPAVPTPTKETKEQQSPKPTPAQVTSPSK